MKRWPVDRWFSAFDRGARIGGALRNLGASIANWWLDRRERHARRAQERNALWAGIRVRIVNKGCCTLSRQTENGTFGTIKRFCYDGGNNGTGDYAVCADGCSHDPKDARVACGYLCVNGFEVLVPGEDGFRR